MKSFINLIIVFLLITACGKQPVDNSKYTEYPIFNSSTIAQCYRLASTNYAKRLIPTTDIRIYPESKTLSSDQNCTSDINSLATLSVGDTITINSIIYSVKYDAKNNLMLTETLP